MATLEGTVDTEHVVIATEGYNSQFHALHRRLLPLYPLIVLTEPLSQAQWESVGWHGGFTLSSQRLSVDYLTKTADGRILFGGRGGPLSFWLGCPRRVRTR